MRKNSLSRIVFVVVFLTLSLPVHAAFNDVTLETTAILDVGGYELTVSGSSAVIESIEVGTLDFSVTLQNGSSITVASADRVDFAYNVAAQTTTETCGATESTLSLSVASAGATTVVVTPSGECVAGEDEAEGGDNSGGGGGSSRHRSVTPTGPASQEDMVKAILEQLILVLQQLIQEMFAQRS